VYAAVRLVGSSGISSVDPKLPAIHAAVLLSNFYIPDSLGGLLSGTGGDTFAPVLAHDTTEVG
jgi:hypothetical protein